MRNNDEEKKLNNLKMFSAFTQDLNRYTYLNVYEYKIQFNYIFLLGHGYPDGKITPPSHNTFATKRYIF